jgi:hypothetical protein
MAKKSIIPVFGSPLAGGFFGGEIIIAGERYALVVAPKAEGEKLNMQYKGKNLDKTDLSLSDDDGMQNSMEINDDNHPAAQFCRGLDLGGFNDWHLPSRDELATIWRSLGPRCKDTPDLFREGGTEAFEPNWYWSSTEHAQDSSNAWVVGFSSGDQADDGKDDQLGVRAVRRIKL